MSNKTSSWSKCWAKDRKVSWSEDQGSDGGILGSQESRDACDPRYPNPRGKKVKSVGKTTILHETKTTISGKRSGPRGAKAHKTLRREEDVLAMSDLKEHVEEALKMRGVVKDDFEEWHKICDEEVILEANILQEQAPRHRGLE